MTVYYILAAVILIGLGICFYWQNNSVVTTEIEVESAALPAPFDGFRILHVSDLHNKTFGRGQGKLLEKMKATAPDIIVITGDIIDRRRTKLRPALSFAVGAAKIAPVYYVAGNHEAKSESYPKLAAGLEQRGIVVLNDAETVIRRQGTSIHLLGLADPEFSSLPQLENNLANLTTPGEYQVLLCHRPELFPLYAKNLIDLSFTGHAHGGQFRLPKIGGLYAPDQGIHPRYTSGLYWENSSALVVSRGLGNSLFPQRLGNRPQLVAVTLRQTK